MIYVGRHFYDAAAKRVVVEAKKRRAPFLSNRGAPFFCPRSTHILPSRLLFLLDAAESFDIRDSKEEGVRGATVEMTRFIRQLALAFITVSKRYYLTLLWGDY